MENTLKVTNVLSDPTRFYIYQYITKRHQDVTVQEIADEFSIHPNVARLHLSKLEDVRMLRSETKKTGKGGRPSRLYRLSDEVIQFSFPFRDYQLLSSILLKTFESLGADGSKALYETGKTFGKEMMEQEIARITNNTALLSNEDKLRLLQNASLMTGQLPALEWNDDQTSLYFEIYNCPFKEVAIEHKNKVCTMHQSFFTGMFEALFKDVQLIEKQNIISGCDQCAYKTMVQ
ncbi:MULTISPECIES: helix-turn-helix transcriptional regulator [Niallia]|jgi:predicted ArsR family transcriptional regulator|uniref:Transcriptional regulator n=1 Tax=Niallia circulans TaxID=1397 RepID=A0A268F8A4_NIACI|nr:helix-turn-helix domain-containing protein [Niallia circulans]AYV67122.1 transcriptional regulator [Niallia circulans]AYV74606.1 transcriptional regulator [Niallia circulans]NRG28164.1 helix-turn-helix domain-containing protein [Niallia circulans]PAD81611.1 transcriptional regulator [Niallia circulans]QJX63085.1 helix-turn-helix domain-containing protein [Niallia circulans]